MLVDWHKKGFACPPERCVSPPQGLTLYRCFGGASRELGSSFYSLEKPLSVVDAELRFNIVDWGNAVRFVSTYCLLAARVYYVGPVAHGPRDLRTAAHQVYVVDPEHSVRVVKSGEVLRQDAFVLPRPDLGRVDD